MKFKSTADQPSNPADTAAHATGTWTWLLPSVW